MFPLSEQPYLGPGGNRTLWTADINTPGGVYFVRVTMLNSTASNATVASNAVAYGQVRREWGRVMIVVGGRWGSTGGIGMGGRMPGCGLQAGESS